MNPQIFVVATDSLAQIRMVFQSLVVYHRLMQVVDFNQEVPNKTSCSCRELAC